MQRAQFFSDKSKNHLYEISKFLSKNLIDKEFMKFQVKSLLDNIDPENENNLIYLLEDQINNLGRNSKKRQYTPSSLLIYLKIYLYSPKIYKYLRENIMIMPHERNIRKIFSKMNVDVNRDETNSKYLKYKIDRLSEVQKIIVLMIDEIHIKPIVESHLAMVLLGLTLKMIILQKQYLVS